MKKSKYSEQYTVINGFNKNNHVFICVPLLSVIFWFVSTSSRIINKKQNFKISRYLQLYLIKSSSFIVSKNICIKTL